MAILQKFPYRDALVRSGRRLHPRTIAPRNWPHPAALHAAKMWKLLRPHQWAKNLLLLLSMIVANRFTPGGLANSACAFVVFSLVASAGYIVNDLLDRDADRRHPAKRRRPVASGQLSSTAATVLAVALYASSLLISIWFAAPQFSAIVACYCGASFLYSWKLKQLVVVDVLVLALFYVLRIIAGGVATNIVLPAWVLVSGFLFFCSLAMLKRSAELRRANSLPQQNLPRRGYGRRHITKLGWIGPLFAMAAMFVMVVSTATGNAELFSNHTTVYLAGAMTVLWLLRMWKLAWKDQMLEDPVAFALRDAISYAAGATVILLFLLAE